MANSTGKLDNFFQAHTRMCHFQSKPFKTNRLVTSRSCGSVAVLRKTFGGSPQALANQPGGFCGSGHRRLLRSGMAGDKSLEDYTGGRELGLPAACISLA